MSTAVDVLTGHLAVARKYAANPDEWPLAPRFDPAKRWFHRLSEEHDPSGPEVWLLSWLPGQGTEWHDHGGSAGSRVNPAQALAAVEDGAILVDIRPAAQRAENGEIPGALIIERNVLEWRFDPRSEARLPIADRFDLKVIVVCQEGYTSSLAAASLQELGLSEATDLAGGFAAWKRAGLPVREVAATADRST